VFSRHLCFLFSFGLQGVLYCVNRSVPQRSRVPWSRDTQSEYLRELRESLTAAFRLSTRSPLTQGCPHSGQTRHSCVVTSHKHRMADCSPLSTSLLHSEYLASRQFPTRPGRCSVVVVTLTNSQFSLVRWSQRVFWSRPLLAARGFFPPFMEPRVVLPCSTAPPMGPVLSQMNPIHSCRFHFF
jgi:hypothetical protein